jgi:hypothetical protein
VGAYYLIGAFVRQTGVAVAAAAANFSAGTATAIDEEASASSAVMVVSFMVEE